MRHRKKELLTVGLFVLAYFCVNLLFLTRYPLVHSDESWLGGLTRNMMASGWPGVTEPFFDLKPRYPHAIKILFHLMQMPLIALFGYGIFPLRLLSLLAGCAALLMAYRCSRRTASFGVSMAVMAMMSVNAQFLTAAHTARQEILLLLMLLIMLDVLLASRNPITLSTALRLGLLSGLSVGLHPNSFLLALGCGSSILLLMAARRQFAWKPLAVYIVVTGALALCFVGLSFLFDAQFPAHYRRYGESEFDLNVSLAEKLILFPDYLQKLWLGESGTYILPGLKFQFVLIVFLLLWGGIRAVRRREAAVIAPLGLTLGALLGTVIIGRYNQLSASLWMLPCLILLAPLLANRKRALIRAAVPAMLAVFALVSGQAIQKALPYDYATFIAQISRYVTPQQKALANLNTGFYFDNDKLLDVRNLAYLKENNLTFAEYVQSRGIEVILWPEEMTFIYDHRPAFNALYGNPRETPAVEAFLRERCTLLGSFENPGYAVRIVQEIGKPYRVNVYRVNPETPSSQSAGIL